MIKLKVYPYKMGSSSARDLARELRATRVYGDRHYHHYSNHIIINWGNSTLPNWYDPTKTSMWLNYPSNVALATNKLATLNALHTKEVSVPEFTTDKNEAANWLDMNKIIVCRKTLTGHSGDGIVIARSLEEIEDAPLYTQHVRHSREFRIHVYRSNVLDSTEKKRRSGSEVDSLVRNHHTGWVYTRGDLVVPEVVLEEAIRAVDGLDLDFGAVDIGYRVSDNKAYVFEVNTAPGLTGTTLTKYVEEFNKCIA